MVNSYERSGALEPKMGLAVKPSGSSAGVDASVATRGTRALGDAIAGLAPMFDNIARPYHEAEGARSVERDEEGNIKVGWRFNFTSNDAAYNASAQQAAFAMQRKDIQDAAQEMAQRNEGNPAGFRKEFDAYSRTIVRKADPLLRATVQSDTENIGGQYFRGISSRAFAVDMQNQRQAFDYQQKDAAANMAALALQGKGGSPEFAAEEEKYKAASSSLVSNPAFGYTKEKADYELRQLYSDVDVNAVVSMTRDAIPKEGLNGAMKVLTDQLDRPELRLDAKGKLRARNLGMAEINAVKKEYTEERRQITEEFGGIEIRDKAGEPISPEELTSMIDRATRSGAVGVVVRAQKIMAKDDLNARMSGKTTYAGMAESADSYVRDSGSVIPTGSAASVIRRFEGFRNTPYWDVNAYRTGYGSDTITKADGSIVRVQPGMQISREDAERDLQRRINTEFVPKAARAAGPAVWSSLNETTRAALTSITYNYGSLPKSVANVVANGGSSAEIAEAVRGLAGHNNGINATRRFAEADMILRGNLGKYGYVPTDTVTVNDRYISSAVPSCKFGSNEIGWGISATQQGALGKFVASFAGPSVAPGIVPYAGAFLNGLFASANSARSQDFLQYGEPTQTPETGNIVVLGNHAGLFDGFETKDGKQYVRVVGGGADGDAETALFPVEEVKGYRRAPILGDGPAYAVPVSSSIPGGKAHSYPHAVRASVLAKDMDERVSQHFGDFESTYKQGRMTTEDLNGFAYMVAASRNPKHIQRFEKLMGAGEFAAQISGLPVGAQTAAIEQMKRLAAAGIPGMVSAQLDEGIAMAESRNKAWNDDPMQAAATIGRMPLVELNYANPATLQARSAQASQVQASEQIGEISPLTKGERAQLASLLTGVDGASASTILGSLSAMQPGHFAATLADDGIQKSLAAMKKSDDGLKAKSAHETLSGQYRRDSDVFRKAFGEDAEVDAVWWENEGKALSPEALSDRAKRRDEPSARQYRKELRTAEDSRISREIKDGKFTAKDVSKKIGAEGWFSSGAPIDEEPSGQLLVDYRNHYLAALEAVGTKAGAETLAVNRIKDTWGVSAASGGKLTKYPPEKFMKPIGGSYDYIKEDLKQWTREQITSQVDEKERANFDHNFDLEQGVAASGGGMYPYAYEAVSGQGMNEKYSLNPVDATKDKSAATARKRLPYRYNIFPDAQTAAEAGRNEVPSYQVHLIRPDGLLEALPKRWVPDQELAKAKEEALFLQNKETISRNQYFADPNNMSTYWP